MTRSIQLTLTKIKHSGDSIGNDIRVEVEILSKLLSVDKKIKARATVEVDHEVGKFETDRGVFQVEVAVTVIEKDLLFNDVGGTKSTLKVNTALTDPQQFIFEVKARESRSIFGKFWGNHAAVFEITLQAKVSDAVRYMRDDDEGRGWLLGVLESDGPKIELPAFLKVQLERTDAKREYFMILEGPYRGKRASIALGSNGSSQFISDIKHEPMVRATYSISKKTVTIKGEKYRTVDDPDSPWRKGFYDIEIPDYSHKGGISYLNRSKRATTWFKIGHGGERCLHAGRHSLGCMTVIEINRWMEIYNTLIKARKGDSMSVGVLEVID